MANKNDQSIILAHFKSDFRKGEFKYAIIEMCHAVCAFVSHSQSGDSLPELSADGLISASGKRGGDYN